MNEQEFQQFLDNFFKALDARQVDVCRQLLDQMATYPLDLRQCQWLDYLRAILCTESSPPRWDRAEQLLLPLLDAKIETELRARVLLELGIIADYQGDYPRAVEYDQRSLALFERLDDRLYQAKILKNLGIAYTRGYELAQFGPDALEKALACHRRSLQICQEQGQEWLASTVQGALGTVYKALGQWDLALAHYQVREATCRRLGEEHALGLMLNNLGEIHQRQRNWHLATCCYREAFNILQKFHDLYESADVLANLASLERDQGRHADALSYYNQAIVMVESIRAALSSEESRIGFLSTEMHVYEGKLKLCLEMNDLKSAFDTLERAKCRAFIELLAGCLPRPPLDVPAEWLTQEKQLRQQLNHLYRQGPHREDAATTRLEQELNELRYKISLHNAEYTSFQVVDPLGLDTVQKRLPSHVLLLEYFVTADAAGVFLISRENVSVILLPSLTLSALRRAFVPGRQILTHLTLDHSGRQHHPWPLAELYRLLIEPIVAQLRGWRLLCIVPHGPLHYIPFHALYAEENGQRRYLLDLVDKDKKTGILYAPSATVLLEYYSRKAPSSQKGALVLAKSNGLRYVEQEGRGVADILGGRLYVGDQACRELIYKEAGQYRFLHFACHGRFNPGFPLTSGLMLADGVLDVVDILQQVRLDADLVTLSGCETGLSALRRGDELIGLVRAFMYAGTPSVLVSLWPVDDLSTRILMEQFYRELISTENLTKAAALWRAQRYLMDLTEAEVRALLAGYGMDEAAVERELQRLRQSAGKERNDKGWRPFDHPYYWAPFMLIGDRL